LFDGAKPINYERVMHTGGANKDKLGKVSALFFALFVLLAANTSHEARVNENAISGECAWCV
jgi:hypothetical protein